MEKMSPEFRAELDQIRTELEQQFGPLNLADALARLEYLRSEWPPADTTFHKLADDAIERVRALRALLGEPDPPRE